jgi:hypothetical protein
VFVHAERVECEPGRRLVEAVNARFLPLGDQARSNVEKPFSGKESTFLPSSRTVAIENGGRGLDRDAIAGGRRPQPVHHAEVGDLFGRRALFAGVGVGVAGMTVKTSLGSGKPSMNASRRSFDDWP